jgi:hypothetical protein
MNFPDGWLYHRNHSYQHRSGKPSVCLRCGVRRRPVSTSSGRRRFAIDDRVGRWQYQAPCQRPDAWQHTRLPCAEELRAPQSC